MNLRGHEATWPQLGGANRTEDDEHSSTACDGHRNARIDSFTFKRVEDKHVDDAANQDAEADHGDENTLARRPDLSDSRRLHQVQVGRDEDDHPCHVAQQEPFRPHIMVLGEVGRTHPTRNKKDCHDERPRQPFVLVAQVVVETRPQIHFDFSLVLAIAN